MQPFEGDTAIGCVWRIDGGPHAWRSDRSIHHDRHRSGALDVLVAREGKERAQVREICTSIHTDVKLRRGKIEHRSRRIELSNPELCVQVAEEDLIVDDSDVAVGVTHRLADSDQPKGGTGDAHLAAEMLVERTVRIRAA